MTVCRDWPATLRSASYGSAAFKVERDEYETGRRLEVHEFPHRDEPYVEDLGRKARRISVTAYVSSDNADGEAAALRRECERGGAKRLVLPLESLRAHCDSFRRTFERDRLGYIAFELSFVQEGAGAGPFALAASGAIARAVEYAGSQIATPLGAAFIASYQGVRVPGRVVASAAEIVTTWAAAFDDARRSTPMEGVAAAAVRREVLALAAAAPALVQVGGVGDRWGERSFVSEAVAPSVSAPLVDRIVGLVADAARAAGPDEAVGMLAPLLTFGEGWEPIRPTTETRRQQAANREALLRVMRVAAVAAFITAHVNRTFADRRQGIQARADLAEYTDAILVSLAGWEQHAVYVEIERMRGQAIEHISGTIASLAPLRFIEAPMSMPSLWWAGRLYGDALRAGELIDRNRPAHPSFMPLRIEALAR